MIAIGVDGGGSKTDVAVVRDDGHALALTRGSASHAHHHGVVGALDVIEAALHEALAEAGLSRNDGPVADVATLTLAGADFEDEVDALTAAVKERAWSARTVVLNDTFAVLRAGTDGGWGVAIVCGSGVNCVGVAPDGTQLRFPSLGTISGDWGGGYDLGLAATFAAARSEDGRGPKSSLERAVPSHFGLETPLQLALAIHRGAVAQRRVAELAPLVFSEAADDPVAAGIVERQANELAAIAAATIRRLGLADEPTPVLLGGGVVRENHGVLVPLVEAGLRETCPRVEVRASSSPPIVGAALLALDELGATADAQARLRTELGHRFERMPLSKATRSRAALAAERDGDG
jgi:N-acetylglucosamine kinase-like BadF-type ATPase